MTLPDLQAIEDHRNLAICKVGIKDYYHPLSICLSDVPAQSTRGIFEITTHLEAKERGTHMSRFVAALGTQAFKLDNSSLMQLATTLRDALKAKAAYLQVSFDLFLEKQAPSSLVKSLMNYEVTLGVECTQSPLHTLRLRVPVATLCPCSKAMSKFNAHNQRCYITVTLKNESLPMISSLISRLESHASCALYALLKRPDEKWVTEMAYENPRFVEDLVRDIAIDLQASNYYFMTVHIENIESIHNHSAIAEIHINR